MEILSGVFDGKTTGTPISLMVRNTSQISADYSEIAENYRPGHADYCFDAKYGFRDYRGGGRSSGRETIGRVAAGAIAAKILEQMGITVFAYTRSIGPSMRILQNITGTLPAPPLLPCRMQRLTKRPVLICTRPEKLRFRWWLHGMPRGRSSRRNRRPGL